MVERWQGRGKRIVVRVKEVRGNCWANIKAGDKWVLEGSTLITKESDNLCPFALKSVMSVYLLMRSGVDLRDFGFKDRDIAILQCIDPGPPHTEGGSAILEVRREF